MILFQDITFNLQEKLQTKYGKFWIVQLNVEDSTVNFSNYSILFFFKKKASFEEVRTPQQKNGFDCGLYCISISEYLGNNYLNRSNESLEKVVTPESINDLRTKIKNIIELKKK